MYNIKEPRASFTYFINQAAILLVIVLFSFCGFVQANKRDNNTTFITPIGSHENDEIAESKFVASEYYEWLSDVAGEQVFPEHPDDVALIQQYLEEIQSLTPVGAIAGDPFDQAEFSAVFEKYENTSSFIYPEAASSITIPKFVSGKGMGASSVGSNKNFNTLWAVPVKAQIFDRYSQSPLYSLGDMSVILQQTKRVWSKINYNGKQLKAYHNSIIQNLTREGELNEADIHQYMLDNSTVDSLVKCQDGEGESFIGCGMRVVYDYRGRDIEIEGDSISCTAAVVNDSNQEVVLGNQSCPLKSVSRDSDGNNFITPGIVIIAENIFLKNTVDTRGGNLVLIARNTINLDNAIIRT